MLASKEIRPTGLIFTRLPEWLLSMLTLARYLMGLEHMIQEPPYQRKGDFYIGFQDEFKRYPFADIGI
jgi:hypothetical protein